MDMTEDSLQHMMRCTNKAGRSKYPLLWNDLDIPQTAFFLSLLFHFDSHPQKDLSDYWHDEPHGDPFVKSTGISRDKFCRWYQCIRLYDPDDVTKEMKESDKVYKVREYLHRVEASCQRMYHPPNPNFSLDEEMAGYVVSEWLPQTSHDIIDTRPWFEYHSHQAPTLYTQFRTMIRTAAHTFKSSHTSRRTKGVSTTSCAIRSRGTHSPHSSIPPQNSHSKASGDASWPPVTTYSVEPAARLEPALSSREEISWTKATGSAWCRSKMSSPYSRFADL